MASIARRLTVSGKFGLHGELSRARLNGTGTQEPFVENGKKPEITSACAMASNGRSVFWVNRHDTGRKSVSVKGELWPTTISRANIAQRTWTDTLVTGTEYSWGYCGIAASAKSLFWTDGRLDAVLRSGVDGSNAKPFVTGLSGPCATELAGKYVYWDSGPWIGRAAVSGGKVDRRLARLGEVECTWAVDSLTSNKKAP